jgi:hypothetical protein
VSVRQSQKLLKPLEGYKLRYGNNSLRNSESNACAIIVKPLLASYKTTVGMINAEKNQRTNSLVCSRMIQGHVRSFEGSEKITILW